MLVSCTFLLFNESYFLCLLKLIRAISVLSQHHLFDKYLQIPHTHFNNESLYIALLSKKPFAVEHVLKPYYS